MYRVCGLFCPSVSVSGRVERVAAVHRLQEQAAPSSPAATLLSSANPGPAETDAPVGRSNSLSGGSTNESAACSGSRRVCQPLPHQSSSNWRLEVVSARWPGSSPFSLWRRKYVVRTPIYTAAAQHSCEWRPFNPFIHSISAAYLHSCFSFCSWVS